MARPSKTALFKAAVAWDVASLTRLLEASPELVTATDARGRTALHIACGVKALGQALGEPDGTLTSAALLDAGGDLETEVADAAEGDFHATPLWFAVCRGENLPLTQFLLDRGADPAHGLWAVVWRDDERFCRELLAWKPRLNLRANGETPIFYAARLKRVKTLDLLIDAGADPTVVDDLGRDALDIARSRRVPAALLDRLAEAKRRVEEARSAAS